MIIQVWTLKDEGDGKPLLIVKLQQHYKETRNDRQEMQARNENLNMKAKTEYRKTERDKYLCFMT